MAAPRVISPTNYAPETSYPLCKLALWYKALVRWMREAWCGPRVLAEPPEVVMNKCMDTIKMQNVQEQEADVQDRLIEEHLRALWSSRLARDFSEEEIANLCRLRDSYQHGGSDRAEVLHRWGFMKYLVEQHLIDC